MKKFLVIVIVLMFLFTGTTAVAGDWRNDTLKDIGIVAAGLFTLSMAKSVFTPPQQRVVREVVVVRSPPRHRHETVVRCYWKKKRTAAYDTDGNFLGYWVKKIKVCR